MKENTESFGVGKVHNLDRKTINVVGISLQIKKEKLLNLLVH